MTEIEKLTEAMEWVNDAFQDIDESRVALRKSNPTLDRAERCLKTIRAHLEQLKTGGWNFNMDEAPDSGIEFIAHQDGEYYHAKRDEHGRILFKTHNLREVGKTYRIIDAVLDGKAVKAQVLIDEGEEIFEHHWTIWTRGFEFKPTAWQPLPATPNEMEG